jgi:HPt (histidine-containing phosphotransfer) domain-containing protein
VSTFDYAEALTRMNTKIIPLITPVFLEHLPHELDSLRQAIAEGNVEEVLRRAHDLKSTLATFGAKPAECCAADIEALAKASDLTSIATLLPNLFDETKRLTSALTVGLPPKSSMLSS